MGERPRRAFINSIPRVLTRVRLSPLRVAVDTPDVMIAMFTFPFAVLALFASIIGGHGGSWPWLVAFAIVAGLGPRLHLRVSPSGVLVVRTVAWVPWWFTRCKPRHDERFTRMDFDGYYLVAPTRADMTDVEDKTIILSALDHGVGDEAITEIASAARAVLERAALRPKP